MSRKRVVVTGLGVVSCFGNDVDHFYNSLLQGQSGVSPITQFPCEEYTTRFAASIKDFSAEDYLDRKQARRVDPFIAYGIVASKKALEQAGLTGERLEGLDRAKCGVLIGSGMGGMSTYNEGLSVLNTKGVRKVSPFFIPYTLTNMAGGLVAIETGFMGPNYSISSACATGNYAIINAANHIRNGEADVMLCGGVEAPINMAGLAGFCAVRALSTRNDEPQRASRPWDQARDGFVMGEGAGVILLESLEHALQRGAPILAEYLGGGFSCDAHHITELRPDGSGVSICIENALRDAQVSKDRVNYINAHATSTPQGDMVEVLGIQRVFDQPEKITMNATKSMIGHLLGGAGGIEAVTTVMAISTGKVHGTLNLENPEPSLNLHVPTEAVEMRVDAGLSNSFGFGGHNAAMLFGRFNG